MKKSTLLLLALLAAAAMLLTPEYAHAQMRTLRIAFNAPDLSQPQYAYTLMLLQREGEALGVTIFSQDGKGTVTQQVGDLMNTVNMGLDGVILVPNDGNALAPTVNDVLAANTPIVTIVNRLNGMNKPLCQLGGGSALSGLNAQAKQALVAIVSYVRDSKPLQSVRPK